MFATLPVTALRTFEAAARLRSFKLASAELAVTPTAVSHQIKLLERQVGVALFDRVPRGVRLTDSGARLFASVHGALLEIAQTLDALRPEPASGALTLSTTHSFAALWLVPRLGRFHQAYPQYQLNLQTGADAVDLLQDASVDVAVRYSRQPYPALHTAATLPEWFGVYGAPTQIAQLEKRTQQRTQKRTENRSENPSKKRTPPPASPPSPALVTVRWRDSDLYDQGWRAWCQAAGLPAWREPSAVHAYEEEHYALQAAIAGQGLVLASSVMVSDSVRAGTLASYRPQVRVPGAAYQALCAPGRERHPPVKAFLAWLTQEFQA
ncbi:MULTISPECIES: LysR substrate-binding domain-containing protein [Achromobacter]|uniref:LysR substrate-binding domain-containing protein n=1 Tax=Achromobacter spanius TaxID=217203 RepID=A0ABY8GVI0_9BURK|nr:MULTISPECIES: LysR substrate-binding domain-containing protein [Achromobacter]WAI82218.1 LysR substrate-binding domain-containing protein [Achromobacter spanius]WEX92306.1 LysR substrate-binding domain-containing protein [Achromobacter sp. SS2-2022]WFP08544.1 LysR substrate-binding domain-containing protein [Achromobacter spanius]